MIASLIILFVVLLLVVDLEVPQLIDVFSGGHHSQPIPQIILLEVLFGQILQISLREGDVTGDTYLGLCALDSHQIRQVLCLTVHFDPLLQVCLLQIQTNSSDICAKRFIKCL
jgi:hypothetical protein